MAPKNRSFVSADDRCKAGDLLYELVPQLGVISGSKVGREMKRRSGMLITYIEYPNYWKHTKLAVSELSPFGLGLKGQSQPCGRVSLAKGRRRLRRLHRPRAIQCPTVHSLRTHAALECIRVFEVHTMFV
jgi:hypothetical protein